MKNKQSFSAFLKDTHLIGILLLVILITLSVVVGKRQEKQWRYGLVDRWNNAIHVECGGNLEYQQMIAGQHWTGYVYRCDKCGRIETFPYQMEFYDPENPPED